MLLDFEKIIGQYNMNINGVIHVGAHHGEEHIRYLNARIPRVVYFEPVRKIFDILTHNIKSIHKKYRPDCETTLYNFALGNNNTNIEMFVESIDKYGCSSILEPSSNYSHIQFSEKEAVKMRRLDDMNLNNSFNFLNIDVQGYELEVLKGSKNTLRSIDYIMCEINRKTPKKILDYHGASLIEDICLFLGDYGFNLVEENWAGISWGDGFFVKGSADLVK